MASMGLGYSLFEQGVQLQLGRSLEHLPHPLLKDLKAVYEPSLTISSLRSRFFLMLLKCPPQYPNSLLWGSLWIWEENR